MSPYHQGPPFPVSSSPILPLDALPTRSRRFSPLFLEPRLSIPNYSHRLSDPPSGLSNGQSHYDSTPNPPRSIPSEWTSGETTSMHLNTSRLGPQGRQDSIDSAETTSTTPYMPSNPLPSAPVGWDIPMSIAPYAPFPESTTSGSTTFFYRSPTPSARQRTNQACEKCRDRKTKCSGGRPTCSRCQARGLLCEYASEHRVRGPTRTRKRNLPSLEAPMSAASTRGSFSHHPYAPAAASGRSKWNIETGPSRAVETGVGLRTGWSLSDHSDESSDSSGAASYEYPARNIHIGLTNARGLEINSQLSRQGFNAMDYPNYRSHTMHRSSVDIKEQPLISMRRVSASMPQLKPMSFQHGSAYNSHDEASANTPYSAPMHVNDSFVELLSSSQESLHSRCPSSSSSCASQSHSSTDDDQNPLPMGTSSKTVMLEGWPSTVETDEEGDLWKAKDPVHHATSAAEAEGETPKSSSSQPFNVSEWITGADYSSSPEQRDALLETANAEN